MKKIAAFIGMAFLAVGCAAQVDAPADQSSSSTTQELTGSGEGGACGGFTAHPKQCATGLVCSHVNKDGTIINPDRPGVCEAHPYAGAGDHCGGNLANAPVCATGYACAGGALIGDVGGTCVKVAAYGESCGGFVAHPVACDAGLACSHVDANGNVINPDHAGVCLEALGEHCGGFVANAKVCASPLHCQLSHRADVGGTCAQ